MNKQSPTTYVSAQGSAKDFAFMTDILESDRGRQLTSTAGLHLHTCPHTCKYAYTYTQIHKQKRIWMTSGILLVRVFMGYPDGWKINFKMPGWCEDLGPSGRVWRIHVLAHPYSATYYMLKLHEPSFQSYVNIKSLIRACRIQHDSNSKTSGWGWVHWTLER